MRELHKVTQAALSVIHPEWLKYFQTPLAGKSLVDLLDEAIIKVIATGTGSYSGTQTSGPVGPVIAAATPVTKYKCNSDGTCVQDVTGTYTTSNCDNSCTTASVWIPGKVNTALAGKYVYRNDSASDNWVASIATCSSIGGRMPNLTELQAIYANKLDYGTFSGDNYWCDNNSTGDNATVINFTTGNSVTSLKTISNNLRCVK